MATPALVLLVVVALTASTVFGCVQAADGVTMANVGGGTVVDEQPLHIVPAYNGTGPLTNIDHIDNRTWASVEGMLRHEDFVSYATHIANGTAWERQRAREHISAYNIETKIGRDIDAYEISALATKKGLLIGTASNHTTPQKRFYEWAFEKYNISDSVGLIDQRLTAMMEKNDLKYVPELVGLVDSMTDGGGVPGDLNSQDVEFWSKVRVSVYCELEPSCDWSSLEAAMNRTDRILPIVTYGRHIATIYILYKPCYAAIPTCSEFKDNIGNGIQSQEIPSPVNHIRDPLIEVTLTNYGLDYDDVVATAKIFYPPPGSNTVVVHDDDGYVNDSGYLRNPHERSQAAVGILFTSYSYAR